MERVAVAGWRLMRVDQTHGQGGVGVVGWMGRVTGVEGVSYER